MNDESLPAPKVLVVDDRVENRVSLEAILEGMAVEILCAASGEDALGLVLEHRFSVVLMDVQMPGMDGFETVGIMRQHPRTRSLPVVFITAISTERRFVSKGYEVGAVDYLFKPVDTEILRGKVRVFVELDTKTQLLEQRNAELERLSAKLRDIAITDPLTGLHNRRFLAEIVESEINLSRRQQVDSKNGAPRTNTNSDLGFLMVDIDHFKRVNDERGHDVGDQVLVEVAARIRDSLRASDTIVRRGGEEFLALLRQTEAAGLERVAERIRTAAADGKNRSAAPTPSRVMGYGRARPYPSPMEQVSSRCVRNPDWRSRSHAPSPASSPRRPDSRSDSPAPARPRRRPDSGSVTGAPRWFR
jgi:diguanylate cyclase (GGDEF)-like protein